MIQSQFKCLTDMCVDSANTILITTDIEGFLSQWDISAFCINEKNKSAKCTLKYCTAGFTGGEDLMKLSIGWLIISSPLTTNIFNVLSCHTVGIRKWRGHADTINRLI